VQAYKEPGFEARSLYYWAKLYASQLKEGDLYPKLKSVICINVLNFYLIGKKTDRYHSCFVLMDRQLPEYILTDHLAIHFLELPKIEDKFKDDKLLKWLLFLKNEGKKEELMEILIKNDPDIARAHKEYNAFTRDDELRELYEAREKWKKDYNTAMYYARVEGIEEGKKEGKKEGKVEGINEGVIIEKQNVLTRILKNKFGLTDKEADLIKSVNESDKLDSAIDACMAAEVKENVLRILK
jgi:predicted transposase/invertase (TIGR01784 family)